MSKMQEARQKIAAIRKQIDQQLNAVEAHCFRAKLARGRGDHAAARAILKEACDLEYGATGECEATGILTEAWYPGDEI